MKIDKEILKREKPPNWEEIVKFFPVEDNKNVVFTYSPHIYAPGLKEGETIDDHLFTHELMHLRQQGEFPDQWWERYLRDPEFREKQELEAYAAQYQFVKEKYGSNNAKRLLFNLASDLAGPIYQLDLEYHQAEARIRNYEKYNKS